MHSIITRHQEVDEKEQRDRGDLLWRWVGVRQGATLSPWKQLLSSKSRHPRSERDKDLIVMGGKVQEKKEN